MRFRRLQNNRLDPHRFDGLPGEKHVRIKDESVLDWARSLGVCENCHGLGATDPHHCRTRGAGGADTMFNIIALCRKCHDFAHRGIIPKVRLRQIIVDRTPEMVSPLTLAAWRQRNPASDGLRPTILAFLQCQWFPAKSIPAIESAYARHGNTPETRARLTRQYLFFRCLTGKRLRAAFGELCDDIVWEESTTQIASVASGAFPPDLAHMQSVVDHFKPRVVLLFGRIPGKAIEKIRLEMGTRGIFGPHPAARHATVLGDLRKMAEELREAMEVRRK